MASLTILDKKLYVGTSWGCLIVADAHTMRPISVFRPFSEEIQAIIPISTAIPPTEQGSTAAASMASTASSSSLIVTLGKGYRSLVKRFVSHRRRNPKVRSVSVADYDGGVEDDDDDGAAMAMSALLWRPDDWLCA